MTTHLDAALTYYRQGYCPVLLHGVVHHDDGTTTCTCGKPTCKSQGKHPRLRGWGHQAAAATEDQIKAWWQAHPEGNVGLLCGNWSAVPAERDRRWIVVLDVDAKPSASGPTGPESLASWQAKHSRLPATPRQRTRSGGYHYFFAHPGSAVKTRANVMPSVDVRGDKNGQVVVAPSEGYEWEVGLEVPLAPLPAGLLGACQSGYDSTTFDVAQWPDEHDRARRARAYMARFPPAIAGKGGDATTWQAAMHVVRGFALDVDTALDVMREYNRRCVPPWDESVLRHKVQSAAKDATMPWGAKLGERGPKRSAPRGIVPQRGGWQAQLKTTRDGVISKQLYNVVQILSHSDGWDGTLYMDDFALRVMLARSTPAHATAASDQWPRQWRESDDVLTAAWVQEHWHIDVSPGMVADAVTAIGQSCRRHPVREYISALSWDRTSRLATWLHTYLGAEQTEYVASVGTKWLLSAVARIFQPGCQADSVLILEGPQGARKSTALEALASQSWFTDQLSDLGQGKDAAQDLIGKWIIEIAELDAIRRADTSRIKAFFTRRTDHYRAPYGRYTHDYPRQCVFAGTVNHTTYLSDGTGNRRFWPVKVGQIDIGALRCDRDQLWAEARARYENGEPWWIEDAPLIEQASREQEDRYICDPWEDLVAGWLQSDIARQLVFQNGGISTMDLLDRAISLSKDRWDRRAQTRVGIIMARLGWRRERPRSRDGTRTRMYVGPT